MNTALRVECNIRVINKLGLHARAAAKLVKLSSRFESSIILDNGSKSADAKSIMQVLMLAASQETDLLLTAEGSDARQAASQITGLFENRFDEDE